MNMKTEKWLGNDIRFIEMENEWWAVAKDVADALGYSETAQMTRHLESEYVNKFKPVNLTGLKTKNDLTAISEHGIYRAIFRSTKKEARQFEKWVISILKQLRQSIGLESYEALQMLSKERQKLASKLLHDSLDKPEKVHHIKANAITNKAIGMITDSEKLVKKEDTPSHLLSLRQDILDATVKLIATKENFGLDIKVSETIYRKYCQEATS